MKDNFRRVYNPPPSAVPISALSTGELLERIRYDNSLDVWQVRALDAELRRRERREREAVACGACYACAGGAGNRGRK